MAKPSRYFEIASILAILVLSTPEMSLIGPVFASGGTTTSPFVEGQVVIGDLTNAEAILLQLVPTAAPNSCNSSPPRALACAAAAHGLVEGARAIENDIAMQCAQPSRPCASDSIVAQQDSILALTGQIINTLGTIDPGLVEYAIILHLIAIIVITIRDVAATLVPTIP